MLAVEYVLTSNSLVAYWFSFAQEFRCMTNESPLPQFWMLEQGKSRTIIATAQALCATRR